MAVNKTTNHKKILVVVRWPLGGIRTYMRYTFRHFPQEYHLTLIASSTSEDEAFISDAKDYGENPLIIQHQSLVGLAYEVFKELSKNRYDAIISQGFISGVAVYLANLFFRRPHILTIHGILEPKLLVGKLSWLKHIFLGKLIESVAVLYAVSNDMLNHLHDEFPTLKKAKCCAVVIPNGIEMSEFELPSETLIDTRNLLGIPEEIFLFGFFGRFMPQKGFDLLIEAVDILSKKEGISTFAVVAVGSGDYLGSYRKIIAEMNLERFFYFLPFQPQLRNLYCEVNAITMPSRWEASGLLAMEALSMGVPLIASDCIGLRETVAGTPAFVFNSENVDDLIHAMSCMLVDLQGEVFRQYMPVARQRFDVAASAQQLVQVIEGINGFSQKTAE